MTEENEDGTSSKKSEETVGFVKEDCLLGTDELKATDSVDGFGEKLQNAVGEGEGKVRETTPFEVTNRNEMEVKVKVDFAVGGDGEGRADGLEDARVSESEVTADYDDGDANEEEVEVVGEVELKGVGSAGDGSGMEMKVDEAELKDDSAVDDIGMEVKIGSEVELNDDSAVGDIGMEMKIGSEVEFKDDSAVGDSGMEVKVDEVELKDDSAVDDIGMEVKVDEVELKDDPAVDDIGMEMKIDTEVELKDDSAVGDSGMEMTVGSEVELKYDCAVDGIRMEMKIGSEVELNDDSAVGDSGTEMKVGSEVELLKDDSAVGDSGTKMKVYSEVNEVELKDDSAVDDGGVEMKVDYEVKGVELKGGSAVDDSGMEMKVVSKEVDEVELKSGSAVGDSGMERKVECEVKEVELKDDLVVGNCETEMKVESEINEVELNVYSTDDHSGMEVKFDSNIDEVKLKDDSVVDDGGMEVKVDLESNEVELKDDSVVDDSGLGVNVDANEKEVMEDLVVDGNEIEEADSKVESGGECVCMVEAETRLQLEGDDVGLEEKPEVEAEMGNDRTEVRIGELSGGVVGSEGQTVAEGMVAMENLTCSAVLDKVVGDTVEENLVVEAVTKMKDDELKSVPVLNDENVEMGTENEDEDAMVDGVESVTQFDDLPLAEDENQEDEIMVEEEEVPAAETEMETETDAADSVKVSGGKRKRGRNSKVPEKAAGGKKTILVEEEDVCFICFDGGDLVLCDRKNCPKAYHPSCVNRDEKFFQTKGRWTCGWHQCSSKKCQKSAHYMCYTCTFSLCKDCVKDSVILCIRGNKGFCEACMKIVMLIEDSEQGHKAQIDFDDKSSWEFLFKDYWIHLKEKLSISSTELARAKNPCKRSDYSPDEKLNVNDGVFGSDNPSDYPEASKSKRKTKKRLKPHTKHNELITEAVAAGAVVTSKAKNTEWASKELLELVMHMKDGDKAALSQFDVQALLLEYIKRNKLRDPRRKSHIICDARLVKIFGKARVGHFEMLKLLESHFLLKEDTQIDDVQGSVVDTEVNQLDTDGNGEPVTKGGKDKKRKMRRKDGRGRQQNLEDYAAIDNHNISLIYLKRKLMEDLLEDTETFNDKVVGTFVRIRISGSTQKQDIYRLVQVVGTSKADELYKVGKRTTDIMLEILNLNKTEVIPIDTISNQEFTEDECKRLRQSIKCGLISPLTVGDILDKAMEVQVARVNDWLESEVVRLSHLRDRASDLGKKKQLRECVESLQLLNTPEERRRRLEEIPAIHADPKMDPSFESDDNDSETDANKQELYRRPRSSGFSRREGEPISPGSGDSKESWSGSRKNSGRGWEANRNFSNISTTSNVEDASLSSEISTSISLNQGRVKLVEDPSHFENPSLSTSSDVIGFNRNSVVRLQSFSHVAAQSSPASQASPVATTVVDINETEKMWHYQDPAGKVQGPFSVVQLRKWSNTGYFPTDLQIWRTNGNKDDSILLTDVLAGKLQKLPLNSENPKANNVHSTHLPSTHIGKPYGTNLQLGREGQDEDKLSSNQKHIAIDSHVSMTSRGWAAPSAEVSVLSAAGVNSNYGSRNISVNLPSPTPRQNDAGWAGGEVGSYIASASPSLKKEVLQSPAAATPDSFKSITMVTERSSLSSHSAFNLSPNSGQHVLISSNDQTSKLTPTIGLHGVPNQNHPTVATETNFVASSNPAFGTNGWGTASSQSSEANSSMHTGGQLSYGQYDDGPSTAVQNPAGNFQTPGVSSMLPSDTWRPSASNPSNVQAPVPVNLPWGMGMAENNASMQKVQPGNQNFGWGAMPVNQNMAWGGQFPNPNMNWVPSVQGAPLGYVHPGWVMPTGNPVAGFHGTVPGNLNSGWVAPPANAGPVTQMLGPMNAQGWVNPTANMGPSAQGEAVHGNGNQGWAAPTGNLGPNVQGTQPGNTSSGWGSAGGSQSNRRNEDHHNRDKYSGQRDWNSQRGNKQSSYGGSSRGICHIFQQKGYCTREGCKFQHS